MTVAVSVIIPVYNRQNMIVEAIESALRQTIESIEVLVIDDSSTDRTKDFVRTVTDSRVRLISLTENSGVSRARNAGLENASGEYVAFLDSDDLWHPEKLGKQVALAEENCELALISCDWQTSQDGFITRVVRKDGPSNISKLLGLQFVCATPTVLIRRAAIAEGPWFDTAMHGCEDAEFWIRLAASHEFGHVSEPLVTVRKTKGSLGANADAQIQGLEYLIAKHEQFYAQYGPHLKQAAKLKIIRRLLADGDGASVHRLAKNNLYPNRYGVISFFLWIATSPVLDSAFLKSFYVLRCLKLNMNTRTRGTGIK